MDTTAITDVMQGYAVDWGAFFKLMPLTLIGLIIHLLSKLRSAKVKPGFTMKLFWQLNWLSYAIAFLTCVVGLWWLSAGIILLPSVAPYIVAFVLGIGGGSLVKKIIKVKAPEDGSPDADPGF